MLYRSSAINFGNFTLDIFQKMEASYSLEPNLIIKGVFLADYIATLVDLGQVEVVGEQLKNLENIILQIEPDDYADRIKMMKHELQHAPKSLLISY